MAFPAGERGLHQVMNRGDSAVRFLVVSEMVSPEVNVYPDSGRVGVFGRAPGSAGPGMQALLPLEEGGSFWEGESPPEP